MFILIRQPLALFGLFIVIGYFLLALGGPMLAPYSPTEQHFADTLQAPSSRYWFGTDQFGRDVFSRVIVGSQTIIGVATFATALSLFIGSLIGVLAGYLGGWWDEALMRATDVMLAFPALLLAMLIITMLGSDLSYLIITIAVVFSPGIARVIRSEVLSIKAMTYIKAAHALGCSPSHIIMRHILPNILGVILVEGSIYFGYAIFAAAGLGFLGLGVQPPSPDWGLQVNDGRNFLLTAPWVALFPALAISSLVIGVNLLAMGLGQVFGHQFLQ